MTRLKNDMPPIAGTTVATKIFHACALVPSRLRRGLILVASFSKGRVYSKAWWVRGIRFGRRRGSLDPPGGYSYTPPENWLETYFDSHLVGPGIWKWRHYFEIYHRHLDKFRNREVRIVEIGVYSGGSLGMWKDYFGVGCQVYGVDIEPACRVYEKEGIRVFIGDQSDPGFWREFLTEVPRIDVVIDDGGHLVRQQVATFEALFGALGPGGVYICEDVHGVANGFHEYICGLSRNLNEWDGPTGFQRVVDSIHVYPFMTVVEKRCTPLTEMTAPKRGTQWQPFL